MRVSKESRDALATIAAQDLGGVSLDEALRVVLFEHRTAAALARLAAEPAQADDYVAEARQLAENDAPVDE
jgi:ribosomal protein L12E/L44/L45/RPP1/RPP2